MLELSQLRKIMPHATNVKANLYLPHLNKAMAEFGINNKLRAASFLAQMATETADLKYVEEIASGAEYEGRKNLGNTQKGDGRKFKGRGLFQLTGRANYAAAAKDLGLPLVEHPDLLMLPEIAARTAGWFWNTKHLSPLADAGNFREVTRRVNGAIAPRTHYPERQATYARGLSVLPDDFNLDDVVDDAESGMDVPDTAETAGVVQNKADVVEEQIAATTANAITPRATIVPVEGGGHQDNPQLVTPVAPTATGRVKRLYTTIATAIAGAGITMGSAFKSVGDIVAQHKVEFAVGAGIIALVVVIYLAGQFFMDYHREQIAAQMTMKQLEIAADPHKVNTQLSPPETGIPDKLGDT